jgi:hypothetical protein
MHRLVTTSVSIFAAAAFLVGGQALSTAASPRPVKAVGTHKIKPKTGHVILNPSAAQSFIYLPQSTVREKNNDILITDGGNWDRAGGKIVELNPQGKPVWVYTGGLDFPHSAYPIANNNILISDTNNDRVFIINRKGQTVWSTDNLGGGNGYLGQGKFSDGGHLLYPNDAVRMPGANGKPANYLLSSRFNNTVWEINAKGKVQWKCARFMFRQHRPRIPSSGPYAGDLIVADSDNGRVLIINHACSKIVFQYGGNGNIVWPRSFDVLPNGNFIVGDSQDNRVLEINSKKQILHQFKPFPQPYYIETQSNGNLLFGDTGIHGAVELSPSGKIVHQYSTVDPHALPQKLVNGDFEKSKASAWIRGDLLSESLPPGVRADMAFDTHVKHSGKSSGRISWTANTSHLFLFWQQDVAVKAGKRYTLTGWIKTKNVTTCAGCNFGKGSSNPGSAYYVVQFQKRSPYTAPQGSVSNQAFGTTGWTKDRLTFRVPAGVKSVAIQAVLFGRGTAWFDSVTLK